jgi:hypothetical protein
VSTSAVSEERKPLVKLTPCGLWELWTDPATGDMDTKRAATSNVCNAKNVTLVAAPSVAAPSVHAVVPPVLQTCTHGSSCMLHLGRENLLSSLIADENPFWSPISDIRRLWYIIIRNHRGLL